MKVCGKGHEYRGDENYRARRGWCPVCHRENQQRYNHSEKGADRIARYKHSPKGWRQSLIDRRNHALARRRNRPPWAEDQGGNSHR